MVDIIVIDQDELNESEKNLWREFCNQIGSSDNFLTVGYLYIALEELHMLNYIPRLVLDNFKYQEGIKDITERVSVERDRICKDSSFAKEVCLELEKSITEKIKSVTDIASDY